MNDYKRASEYFERTVHSRKEMMNAIHRAISELDKEYLTLLEQLQQAQAKAERYKNHLLCIHRHYGLPSEPTDFVPVTVLYEIQMIVSNALKDDES